MFYKLHFSVKTRAPIFCLFDLSWVKSKKIKTKDIVIWESIPSCYCAIRWRLSKFCVLLVVSI